MCSSYTVGGTFSLALELIYVGILHSYTLWYKAFWPYIHADPLTDIALVEYLTSDDAGKPLRGRFAWPVGLILTRTGVMEPVHNGSATKMKEMNGKKI